MIKLKHGTEISFDGDYDTLFQKIISAIVEESVQHIRNSLTGGTTGDHKTLSKELMDQSILVSHQLIEISKVNTSIPQFIISGLLFNCIALTLSGSSPDIKSLDIEKEPPLH